MICNIGICNIWKIKEKLKFWLWFTCLKRIIWSFLCLQWTLSAYWALYVCHILYSDYAIFVFPRNVQPALQNQNWRWGECQECTCKCLYRSTSRSGVFIVSFENISLLFLVSIVDFEQVNVSWKISLSVKIIFCDEAASFM